MRRGNEDDGGGKNIDWRWTRVVAWMKFEKSQEDYDG